MSYPYALTESLSGMYASLSHLFDADGAGNEARDPTHSKFRQQPFTPAENVSPAKSFHHHAVDHMARQQIIPPGPLSSSASASTSLPTKAMTGSDHGTCFLSAPCDKPDCDEATICYDYSLPHYADIHCTQDAFSCPETFDCAETNCHAADWVCTELDCHEPACNQEDTRECTPASTAASRMSVLALILPAQNVLNRCVTINTHMPLPQSATLVLLSLAHNHMATKSRQSLRPAKMPCRLAPSVLPQQTLSPHRIIFNL
jgi:hypothetical protein